MSLIYCPECGHEISQAAIACPSCGRPINAAPPPPIERPVIVTRPREEGGFPPWAFIPLGILGVSLLFLLFYVMSRNDESANSNLNVNISTQRASNRSVNSGRTESSQTTTIPPDTTTVTAPPADSQTVNVPGSQTSIPADATKGRVVIDAKVAGKTGSPQAVKNEKFYLLDKDLDSILSDANLEPIEGQSLANSFGLSVVYPDRYGEFNRDALAAIKTHIKYSGTTDGTGKAQFGGIEPDSYYLFGITKTGRGFALWSNPVSIRTGENILNLSPQRITEMEKSSE